MLSPAEFEEQVGTAGAGHTSVQQGGAEKPGPVQNAAACSTVVGDMSRLPRSAVRKVYKGLEVDRKVLGGKDSEVKALGFRLASRAITGAENCCEILSLGSFANITFDCILITPENIGAEVTRRPGFSGQADAGPPIILQIQSRSLFKLRKGDSVQSQKDTSLVVVRVSKTSAEKKSQKLGGARCF